ncbi:N-acetyl-D-Glu racemase DgcA [Balneatrix alpica]|uniref:Dipeptide epimerase n=1 Tax=Balneatrix alpica TaxID=75684 RepID=A0ABV5ZAK8_9GAMM|nr:N-acetyl-D-Glu racemase DgcA [Balneatrix alpica]
MAEVRIYPEQWPLHEPFIISSLPPMHFGEVVVVEIHEQGLVGRGECEHATLYDSSYPDILAQLQAVQSQLAAGVSREQLYRLLPPGCARNAVDCALWDLEAKRSGKPVWQLAGMTRPPQPVTTVFTLSLHTPEHMAEVAAANRHRPLLKLKLGQEGDLQRVAAVRAAAPSCRLVIDANMGWTPAQFEHYQVEMKELGVEMIEQPFPPGQDGILAEIERLIPVTADESCQDRSSLPSLVGRYDLVNIKLDKAGGLTEALALAKEAKALGFELMVGCNVGTSLAMAPALLLAQQARYVDIDGPLLLTEDRPQPMRYEQSLAYPANSALWG